MVTPEYPYKIDRVGNNREREETTPPKPKAPFKETTDTNMQQDEHRPNERKYPVSPEAS